MAIDFVIPAIERLQTQHPAIRVLLSTPPRLLDLSRREVDIAIRTEWPDQQGLIVRQLGSWEIGLYASRSYVARRGEPMQDSEFAGHDLAVHLPGVTNRQQETLVGVSSAQGRVVAELDSSLMLGTFVRAGLALGEFPTYMAQLIPELVRS